MIYVSFWFTFLPIIFSLSFIFIYFYSFLFIFIHFYFKIIKLYRSSACGVIDFSAYLFGFTIIVAYPRILEYTIDSARFAFWRPIKKNIQMSILTSRTVRQGPVVETQELSRTPISSRKSFKITVIFKAFSTMMTVVVGTG